jgi:uncharacterized phage-like protein YoqJ
MKTKDHLQKEKICSFFGHRNMVATPELREKLIKTISWLITEKGVNKFLFGSKSCFDDFCQEVVKELREQYPHVRRVYVRMYYPELGEWYISYILQDFEDTYMPSRIEKAGKASYVERNQEMIDASDFCVFYYDEEYKPPMRKHSKRELTSYQPNSGTKRAYEYAKKKKKQIINLYR